MELMMINNDNILVMETLLGSNYRIDEVLVNKRREIIYKGTDIKKEKTVIIRQLIVSYFDDANSLKSISDRIKDGIILLKKSGFDGIIDCFVDTNYVFVISEIVNGKTLSDYIVENGTLSEKQSIELFLPLLIIIAEMNENGIFVRNICPNSIYLIDDKKLTLSGLEIIDFFIYGNYVELLPGYIAPECYDVDSKLNKLTNTYSMAAIMYFALTGERPQESSDRMLQDNLKNIYEYNGYISKSFNKAILHAMKLNQRKRTPDLYSFENELKGIKAPFRLTKVIKSILKK